MNRAQREERNNIIKELYSTGQYTLDTLSEKFGLHRNTVKQLVKGLKPFNGTRRWRREGRARLNPTTDLGQTDATVWKLRSMRNPPEYLPGRHIFRKDGKDYVYYDNDDFWRYGP